MKQNTQETHTLLTHTHFHLVGIKGVAMTSLAQMLVDMGKKITGSDVAEDFVTQPILDSLDISITIGFEGNIPEHTDCLIYTAAHQGVDNPQVVTALKEGLPTYSQAEALGACFNQKKGVAICGVGGKSTVSAMVTWILTRAKLSPSFSVGVGKINGLAKTGSWNTDSEYFIAEADEYVTDPAARSKKIPITPRFSYLKPYITVCTNLSFDHPDVYDDFEHTKSVFFNFFNQISTTGYLVLNYADLSHKPTTSAKEIVTFGTDPQADISYQYDPKNQTPGSTHAAIFYKNVTHHLKMQVPGAYNVNNACAAIAACICMGVSIEESIAALNSFKSTKRRFEHAMTVGQAVCYDDYAHHPKEIAAAITAVTHWYPKHRIIIAFQPHTYSRTKQLLHEFVHALSKAKELYLLDIFASAREKADTSISSDDILVGIKEQSPDTKIENIHSIEALAEKVVALSHEPIVVLTLGAGDIYKTYDLIRQKTAESSLIEQLSNQFPQVTFKNEEVLAPYTTVKIGGPAEVFAQITSSSDFTAIVSYMRTYKLPLTVLGWGANTLIADEGIRGLVLRNMSQGITILDQEKEDIQVTKKTQVEPYWHADTKKGSFTYSFSDLDYDESDATPVYIQIESGVSLPMAINTLIAQGITGLQWFSRIPATIGGAIYNNIHGGTHFIGEFVESVTVVTQDGSLKTYEHADLEFGYDSSRFHKSGEIILSAVLKLYRGDAQRAATTAEEWAKRKSIQPQKSLGCIFQNINTQQQKELDLPTTSVGYIIDHILHKKGTSVGDIYISQAHAAFFENTGSASATEYLMLIKDIISQTKAELGIILKPEIFFLGFSHEDLEGITWHRTKSQGKT